MLTEAQQLEYRHCSVFQKLLGHKSCKSNSLFSGLILPWLRFLPGLLWDTLGSRNGVVHHTSWSQAGLKCWFFTLLWVYTGSWPNEASSIILEFEGNRWDNKCRVFGRIPSPQQVLSQGCYYYRVLCAYYYYVPGSMGDARVAWETKPNRSQVSWSSQRNEQNKHKNKMHLNGKF